MTVRVFLLDDHEVVRHGVAALVASHEDLEVVGEAGSAGEALASVAECKPDVAVLDVRLGDGNGIEVCRELRSAHPDLQCLMFTSFSEDQALIDSALAGAAGFVIKEVAGNQLIASILAVAAGRVLLDPAQVRLARQRLRASAEGRLQELSDQERRIFDLIGEGLTNREIAAELVLEHLDGVNEAAVIGLPHPDFGEAVVGFVTGHNLNAAQLKADCGRQLAAFKCPKQLFVVSELPRNAMGKVQKAQLRSEHQTLFDH